MSIAQKFFSCLIGVTASMNALDELVDKTVNERPELKNSRLTAAVRVLISLTPLQSTTL